MVITVGRHAALDGAGVDPIVAAALDSRPSAAAGLARHGAESGPRALSAASEGGLGWPGDPADGTGLGWPVDEVSGTPGAEQQSAVTLVADEAPARRRSGWRRLFGGGHSNAA